MLLATPHVSGRSHSQRRRKRGPCVPRTETVVFAFRPKHEPIQPALLPDRMKPIPPTRQKFVNVGLVTDVKNEVIRRSIKNPMKCDR